MLWISTNNGLARFNPQIRQFRIFDQSNGLQGRQFNRESHLRSRTGELLFGGTAGFSIFEPRRIKPDTVQPAVVLTRLEIFNQMMEPGEAGSPLLQSITETHKLALPECLSVISFQFAALNYRSPERNRYAFRLEGFDPGWRTAGSERRATYTNLDPGSYTLRVKATNSDGIWNEDGTTLELTIMPLWWRTWWFRISASGMLVIVLVSSGWIVSSRRMKQKMWETEQTRQIAMERQRAAEALQQREEQLRAITANIPGIVCRAYVRPGGQIGLRYVSNRIEELFELPRETEGLLEKLLARIDSRDREMFIESIKSAAREYKPWEFEGRFIKPSGKTIWFRALATKVRGAMGST